MRRRNSGRAVKRAMAFLAILGTFGIAGLVAGAGRDTDSPQLAQLTAADIVELRFPGEWTDLPATPAPAPAPVRLASADMSGKSYSLFAPQPIYALASSTHAKAPPPSTAVMSEVPPTPTSAQPVAAPMPPTRPAVGDTGSQDKPHMQLASARPAAAPATRSLGRPGAVLNDSQIASVKKRLKLTPEQERHWPAVEAALRNIQYKQNSGDPQRAQRGTQTAAVDPNSAGVQQLKSAAFPLVMSFNDDQRREVRTLAHVMGLDGVVSQF